MPGGVKNAGQANREGGLVTENGAAVGQVTRCRGCGQPIVFIETRPNGKAMPCEPEPVRTFRAENGTGGGPRLTLVTECGEVRTFHEVSVTTPGATAEEGYEVHWAKCTGADKFRRKAGK